MWILMRYVIMLAKNIYNILTIIAILLAYRDQYEGCNYYIALLWHIFSNSYVAFK